MPEKVAYIWEIVTDKNYTGKGIANHLIKYITEKYQDFTIYSCIDLTNIASLKLHEKNGFHTLYEFEKRHDDGSISYHNMMVREGK